MRNNDSYIVYGLSNCDATKKAIHWLEKNNVPFTFHSNKLEPLDEQKLKNWCLQVEWTILLNKRGTAFKALHPAVQMNATTEEAAIEIMKERSSTIKRPVIEKNNKIITVGFDEKKYEIAYL